MSLSPIYAASIKTVEDIERVLDNSEEAHDKLRRLPFLIFSDLEVTPNVLNIGVSFKTAHLNSLAFSTSTRVVRGIDNYQNLLKRTLAVSTDTLTPLVLRSFHCHHLALEHFTRGEKEEAMVQMAETGTIARQIADECENLARECNSEREEHSSTLQGLIKHNITARNAASTQPVLKACIPSLERAEKSYASIITTIRDLRVFWLNVKRISSHLSSPDLADPAWIEILEKEGSPAAVDFCKNIAAGMSDPLETKSSPASLTEVVKGMKTGRYTPVKLPNPVAQYFLSMPQSGIESEFESSFLYWLAVAKANLAMSYALQDGISDVESYRSDIQRLEQDPRIIAIREAGRGRGIS